MALLAPAGALAASSSPTPSPVLKPLPVQSVVPLPVRPAKTPAPSATQRPEQLPVAVPAPGAVAGVAAPPAAALPTPALLAPVASLPAPPGSVHGTSPTPWILGLFGFMAILVASTILLARRRL